MKRWHGRTWVAREQAPREEGQERVEMHLRRERPRRADPHDPPRGDVPLQNEEVRGERRREPDLFFGRCHRRPPAATNATTPGGTGDTAAASAGRSNGSLASPADDAYSPPTPIGSRPTSTCRWATCATAKLPCQRHAAGASGPASATSSIAS